jgi:hypothetical protein
VIAAAARHVIELKHEMAAGAAARTAPLIPAGAGQKIAACPEISSFWPELSNTRLHNNPYQAQSKFFLACEYSK